MIDAVDASEQFFLQVSHEWGMPEVADQMRQSLAARETVDREKVLTYDGLLELFQNACDVVYPERRANEDKSAHAVIGVS